MAVVWLCQVPSAKTVQGAALDVKVSEGKVKVGGATVLATDVMASNGVIHVIGKHTQQPHPCLDWPLLTWRWGCCCGLSDTVLLPPAPVAAAPAKPTLATLEVQKAGATAPFGKHSALYYMRNTISTGSPVCSLSHCLCVWYDSGYFDPLGLSKGKTVKELKKWRESELKHGRLLVLRFWPRLLFRSGRYTYLAVLPFLPLTSVVYVRV